MILVEVKITEITNIQKISKNKQKLKAEQLFSSFSKIVFAGMYTHTLYTHLWSFLWHYQVSECNNVQDSWPVNRSKKLLNTSLDLFFRKIAGWTRRVDIIRNTFSKKQFLRNTTFRILTSLAAKRPTEGVRSKANPIELFFFSKYILEILKTQE